MFIGCWVSPYPIMQALCLWILCVFIAKVLKAWLICIPNWYTARPTASECFCKSNKRLIVHTGLGVHHMSTIRTAKQWRTVFAQKWSVVMLQPLRLRKTSSYLVKWTFSADKGKKRRKSSGHQQALLAKQHKDDAHKSKEKVEISVTALYSNLGTTFVYLCTISLIPSLMLSCMLKYSHKDGEPWHINFQSKTFFSFYKDTVVNILNILLCWKTY